MEPAYRKMALAVNRRLEGGAIQWQVAQFLLE
jgi:hypothetical protein